MTYPNPNMAFDSWDYPGSPWKRPPLGGTRNGFALDLSNAVWVPGPMAKDSVAAENALRIALYEAMLSNSTRLK